MRRPEEIGWMIPACALLLPPALLLIGWALGLAGLNRRVILLPFWASFVVAPFVGGMTLMILSVRGNLNRAGLSQPVIRRAALLGGLSSVSPLVLLPLLLILIDPSD